MLVWLHLKPEHRFKYKQKRKEGKKENVPLVKDLLKGKCLFSFGSLSWSVKDFLKIRWLATKTLMWKTNVIIHL